MEFGIQFFPDVSPQQRSAETYWADALHLDRGHSATTVRRALFRAIGGYSPNPIVFLAAAAARTQRIRLITGAVLPVFNNPLKLAGEIGMLDAISGGRLEVGFARAFLPHEFRRFGRSLDESRARFDEGVAQVCSRRSRSACRPLPQLQRPPSLPRRRRSRARRSASPPSRPSLSCGREQAIWMAIPMAGGAS
jgi:hypothetical protein